MNPPTPEQGQRLAAVAVALSRPIRARASPTAPPTRCRRSATQKSAMPISRPIAGMTDCSAVLPAAATSIAAIEQQEMRAWSARCRRRAGGRDVERHRPRLNAAGAVRDSRPGRLAKRRRYLPTHCSLPTDLCRSRSLNATRASHLKGQRRHAPRAGRGASPRWQFLRGFLKHPVMVGSIIPSSRDPDRQDAGPGRLGRTPSCSSNMARASAPSPGRSSTGWAPTRR